MNKADILSSNPELVPQSLDEGQALDITDSTLTHPTGIRTSSRIGRDRTDPLYPILYLIGDVGYDLYRLAKVVPASLSR